MSTSLAFWKYKDGMYSDNKRVYEKCCNEDVLDSLEELPVKNIMLKISEVFSSWEKVDEYNYDKAGIDNNGEGSFSIFTTLQFIQFDCYGMSENDMNILIDIMLEYGCCLYDPQIEVRFD